MTSTFLVTKSLGQTLANASEICTITATGSTGNIGLTLSVVQSAGVNRMYRVSVPSSVTQGWKRLVPYDKTESFPNQNQWAVDVQSSNKVVTLRLVRTKVGTPASTTSLNCKVIAYPSVGELVAITNSTATVTNASNSGIFEGALVTQMDGLVGINTDSPSHILDVSGNVNTSNAYMIGGNAALTSSALGSLVTQSSLTTVGILDSLNVAGSVSLTGLSATTTGNVVYVNPSSGAVSYGPLDLSGNLNVTNLTASGNVSATSLTGTLQTAAQPNVTAVGTLASLSVTGNVAAGNVSGTTLSGTNLVGTLQTAAQPIITSVGTLSSLAVTAGVTASTLTGTLQTAAQPNITSVGTLSSLAVTAAVTASTLTGTLQTAAQPNITSVGSLSSLTVTGNVTIDSNTLTVNSVANRVGIATANPAFPLDVTGSTNLSSGSAYLINGVSVLSGSALGSGITASSLTSVGTLSSLAVTAGVTASTLTGTLATAAQPNITSVGTLVSLTVTGNVAAGNVSGTTLSGTNLVGTIRTAAQPDITSVGTLSSLAVTAGVTASTLTGTLQTAAQPNITSVGNLSSLNVTGNLSLNGSVWASSVIHGTATPFLYTGPGTASTNGVSFYSQTRTSGTTFVTAGGTNNSVFTFSTAGTYMLQAEVEVGFPWMPEGDINTYYLVNGSTVTKFGNESHAPSNFSCTHPYLLTVNASDNVRFLIDSSSGNEYEVGLNSTRLTMLKLA